MLAHARRALRARRTGTASNTSARLRSYDALARYVRLAVGRHAERRVAATCVGAVRCTFFRQLGLWTQCARPEPPRATRAARVGLKHPMVPSPCPAGGQTRAAILSS